MSDKHDIELILNEIVKSNNDTGVSEALKEVGHNHEYIEKKQLKTLLNLHDKKFRAKCVMPVSELHQKFSELESRNGEMQNAAAIIDRDIRVLELAISMIRERGNKSASSNGDHGQAFKS